MKKIEFSTVQKDSLYSVQYYYITHKYFYTFCIKPKHLLDRIKAKKYKKSISKTQKIINYIKNVGQ